MLFLWGGTRVPSGHMSTSEDSWKSLVRRMDDHSGKRAFKRKRGLSRGASFKSKAACKV